MGTIWRCLLGAVLVCLMGYIGAIWLYGGFRGNFSSSEPFSFNTEGVVYKKTSKLIEKMNTPSLSLFLEGDFHLKAVLSI